MVSRNTHFIEIWTDKQTWKYTPLYQGSIPSQGPRHTKDVIKMVPVVPLLKRENTGSFSRIKIGEINVMDKIWDRKSFEVGDH